MTFEDYYISPVAIKSSHPVIIEGLKVSCDLIGCNYEEDFPTSEDAEIGAEIHERS